MSMAEYKPAQDPHLNLRSKSHRGGGAVGTLVEGLPHGDLFFGFHFAGVAGSGGVAAGNAPAQSFTGTHGERTGCRVLGVVRVHG
jgi:hypothetical protein